MTSADIVALVTGTDKLNTYIGDANVDGEFNSSDLVQVFTAGKYETGGDATWGEGDWDGSGDFGSGDLVFAFTGGGYETGPRGALAAVPEPSSLLCVISGALLISLRYRRRFHG